MYGTYCRLRVHVMASDVAVIKAARKRIAKPHRTGRRMRTARHAFFRKMLQVHHDAQALVKEFRL